MGKWMCALLCGVAGALALSGTAFAADTTVVVNPATLKGACQTLAVPVACDVQYPTGWLFYNDEIDAGDPTLGTFVTGPAGSSGSGSVQLSVSGTQRRNLATYAFRGTALADITELGFRTYNPSAGNGGSASRSGYLQFNVDFNGSDTWQRRLVFLPSDNGVVTQDAWKTWDAIDGGNALWRYSGATWPGTLTPGATPRTWGDILTAYSGIRIRVTDAQLSIRVGEPYPDGYTESIDEFVFGTASGTTTFDFEPATTCATSTSGTTITLLADCTVASTFRVPDGFTLDGDGHTITADPAGFLTGAVVENAVGAHSMHIVDLTVDAAGAGGSCDSWLNRLSGIRFLSAGGSVAGSTVQNILQAPGLRGCQEGTGIEIRNTDSDGNPLPGTRYAVSVTGTTVTAYQKTGIVATGNVAASITGSTIIGLGPVDYIAGNGIQVSFGATALIESNAITSNFYTPSSWVSCGLIFVEAGGVKQRKNTFAGNEVNVCNSGRGGGKYNPSS